MARFTRRSETSQVVATDDAAATGIARVLLPGERILASAGASPLGHAASRSQGRLAAVGFAIGLGALKAPDPHASGEHESAAMVLHRAIVRPVTVAITDQRVTFWSFQGVGDGTRPVAIAAFPRAELRWIAKTGQMSELGAGVRFSFVDESFIDLAVREREPFGSFWARAAEMGRQQTCE